MTWASRHIQDLKQGRSVTFKARGNSMAGKIDDGQEVTVTPVARQLKKGDIVLCRVLGVEYLHIVTGMRKKVEGAPGEFQISNAKGRVNGWTSRDRIYGIYEPLPPKTKKA